MIQILRNIIKYTSMMTIIGLNVLLFANYELLMQIELQRLLPYIIGSAIVLLLYIVLLKKRFSFFETFIHEFTHLIFALLTFKKIESFHASCDGGSLSYRGRKDFLVSLAPYFFPVIAVGFILISFYTSKDYIFLINFLIVINYTFFILSIFNQFSMQQPDILETGKLFSICFILFTNILELVFFMFFINDDLKTFGKLFDISNLSLSTHL